MKPTSPKYRHELKYQIDQASALSLKQKLPLMLRRDPHVDPDGTYLITSLYFDNCFDKALREKRHGTQKREKFRLRHPSECSFSGKKTENKRPVPKIDCTHVSRKLLGHFRRKLEMASLSL